MKFCISVVLLLLLNSVECQYPLQTNFGNFDPFPFWSSWYFWYYYSRICRTDIYGRIWCRWNPYNPYWQPFPGPFGSAFRTQNPLNTR
ncbi:unnamed protein product [Heterobilharzia americana]|nr:unnamed protein product [Heterobilharzia americana]